MHLVFERHAHFVHLLVKVTEGRGLDLLDQPAQAVGCIPSADGMQRQHVQRRARLTGLAQTRKPIGGYFMIVDDDPVHIVPFLPQDAASNCDLQAYPIVSAPA